MSTGTPPADHVTRALVHRALGEPLRLAIVDALALSDMMPSEVEHQLGVSSNLLAHHLDALEGAGLITRTRSQGDGRRRYLSLRPETLAQAGVEIAAASPTPIEAERIVFVCTKNSARSPLAMALWEQTGSPVPSTSAGTHPADTVHPLAVSAGRQAGIPTTQHRPQSIEGLRRPGDLLVTVCDQAHEEAAGDLHWSIPNPVREGRPEAFARTIDMLRERTSKLAHHIELSRRRPRADESATTHTTAGGRLGEQLAGACGR